MVSSVSSITRRKLPYEPGLDGLRALAVAGVFLYHANVSWMPGGFLGVDLFFVLSGYLITSLLLHEWSTRGSIGLKSFWGRRARRLFPAVAVVILFALLATLTIARDDLGRTRADALSALVYMTNWHEIIASHSYFNQFGRPSLLQHLWSLAVEEQFYLLWPLLLIAGLRWLRRGPTVALTAFLAAGSCVLMWVTYNSAGDPSRVYYGTDTRAFTLLIGALLAFAWPLGKSGFGHSRRGTAVVDAVGVAALVGVIVMFARMQDFDPFLYHGGFLLMALVGAVLVATVAHPGTILGPVLGCGVLRWIGARSYGIYLWHWPIMQLTRPYVDVPLHGAPLILIQAALTVGAAALSYRFIEMPIRKGTAQRQAKGWLDRRRPRERLAFVSGGACAIITAAGLSFGLPAPTAAAFSSTATASALRTLPTTVRSGAVVSPLGGSLTGFGLTGAGTSGAGATGSGATAAGATAAGTTGAANPGGSAQGGGTDPGGSGASGTNPDGPNPGGTRLRTHAKHHYTPLDVLALGDSVMLGCAPNLEQLIGHGLTVDAVVGRQAEETIGRLAQYRAAGRLPSSVIIQIGDNGPVWYSDMQHLRRVLRGVPHVVIVNVRLARSWQNEVNSELKGYVRTWPQAVLANWYTHSTQAMLTDGVHPSVAARANYARVVYDALMQAERNTPS